MKLKDVLILGALGTGLYMLYKAKTAVSAAFQSAGEAVGSGLFDLFHPDQTGEMLYYTVTFPDGQNHAVASSTVAPDGTFTYSGVKYQMTIDKSKATGVNKTAFPV